MKQVVTRRTVDRAWLEGELAEILDDARGTSWGAYQDVVDLVTEYLEVEEPTQLFDTVLDGRLRSIEESLECTLSGIRTARTSLKNHCGA